MALADDRVIVFADAGMTPIVVEPLNVMRASVSTWYVVVLCGLTVIDCVVKLPGVQKYEFEDGAVKVTVPPVHIMPSFNEVPDDSDTLIRGTDADITLKSAHPLALL